MSNTTLDPPTSEPEQHQRREPHTASLFQNLFQKNPTQDKELMRLCSIYRATKIVPYSRHGTAAVTRGNKS
ncbi:hypothetical protein BGZ94_000762, partial [Podila epigama]